MCAGLGALLQAAEEASSVLKHPLPAVEVGGFFGCVGGLHKVGEKEVERKANLFEGWERTLHLVPGAAFDPPPIFTTRGQCSRVAEGCGGKSSYKPSKVPRGGCGGRRCWAGPEMGDEQGTQRGNDQQASGVLHQPKPIFLFQTRKPPRKLYPASEPGAFVCWISIRKNRAFTQGVLKNIAFTQGVLFSVPAFVPTDLARQVQ